MTNEGAGTVSIINVSTLRVLGTVRVGNQPYQVLITPDGAWAYVSNSGAQTLSIIRYQYPYLGEKPLSRARTVFLRC